MKPVFLMACVCLFTFVKSEKKTLASHIINRSRTALIMMDPPPLPAVTKLPTLPLPQLPPMDSTADAPHASFPQVLGPVPPPHAMQTPSLPTAHRHEHHLLCSATASSISTLSPSVQHRQLSSTSQEAPNNRVQPEEQDYTCRPHPRSLHPTSTLLPVTMIPFSPAMMSVHGRRRRII